MDAWKSRAQATRNVVRAVEAVAARLGNTKAVCRKSYIHPIVLEAYQLDASAFSRPAATRHARANGLEPDEAAVVRLIAGSLRARLRRSA
jgi:DNA topoisomerase-1